MPDVTKEQIEKFCEKGVSMVVFSFNGLSRELCRKMVNEIRLGIFNFSLEKNDRIPYSMALVLNLDGIGFRTGSVSSTKVSVLFKKIKTITRNNDNNDG